MEQIMSHILWSGNIFHTKVIDLHKGFIWYKNLNFLEKKMGDRAVDHSLTLIQLFLKKIGTEYLKSQKLS